MKTKGITTRLSPYSVKETIDKLQALIELNGATIYARIDQQAELKKAGLIIKPLEFLLFGNPAVGGKLILENPVVALDLPLKIIAWEDEKNKIWLGYNEANYVIERYALKPEIRSSIGLDNLVMKALNISI